MTKPNPNNPNVVINPRGLRISDAASYAGQTPWAIEEAIRSRELRAFKPGRHWIVDRHDVDAWIERLKKAESERQELQNLLNKPKLTAEKAIKFFSDCEKDEDGNYILRSIEEEDV